MVSEFSVSTENHFKSDLVLILVVVEDGLGEEKLQMPAN